VTRSKSSASERGAEALIDFTTTKDIAAGDYKSHHIRYAQGAGSSCNEGRIFRRRRSFLWPAGKMAVVGLPKDPTVLAGTPAINAVLKEAGHCWQCNGRGLGFTATRLVHVNQIYKHSKAHGDEVQQPI
jgi:hypothetical protein